MDSTKVLVAIDDEKFAKAIEQMISGLRWEDGTSFKVLHAIEAPVAVANWPSEEYRKAAEALLSSTAERLRQAVPDATVEEVMVEAYAKEAILDLAAEWPADLIILGSHGRRGVERFLLGSVSETVVAHAPCSVVVVRLPGKQKAPPESPESKVKVANV